MIVEIWNTSCDFWILNYVTKKKDKLYMDEYFKPLKLVKTCKLSETAFIAMVDVYLTVILWINY